MGALGDFRRRPLELLLELPERYGDVVHIRLGPVDAVVIRHPDDVRRVLQRNHQGYSKRTRGVKKLRRILGDGLLTSNGESWLRQRRISQPAFHRKRIQHFAETMVTHTVEAMDQWEDIEGAVNMGEEMMLLTLRIASRTLFSSDVQGEAAELSMALTQGMEFFTRSFSRVWDPPAWLPTPDNIRMNRNKARIDRIVDQLVAERRGREEEHGDLLSMLMLARDEETGEALSGPNLRDTLLTLLIAGHETTANALSWVWHFVSTHRDVAAQLRLEVDEVLGGRPPGLEDLGRLPLVKRVIEETLRLRPPGWFFGRMAEQEDVLGGFRIPRGWLVLISPYATHRHPDFWPDPERFDPDRHQPEATEARPPFSFLPFSGGPRNCIGSSFAMMEMQLVLALVMQRFILEPAGDGEVGMEPLVTLRPMGGVPIHLEPREGTP